MLPALAKRTGFGHGQDDGSTHNKLPTLPASATHTGFGHGPGYARNSTAGLDPLKFEIQYTPSNSRAKSRNGAISFAFQNGG